MRSAHLSQHLMFLRIFLKSLMISAHMCSCAHVLKSLKSLSAPMCFSTSYVLNIFMFLRGLKSLSAHVSQHLMFLRVLVLRVFLTSLMFQNSLYVDIWLTVVGQANMEPWKRGRTIAHTNARDRGSSSSSLARLMPELGPFYQPERDEPDRSRPAPGLLQSAFDAADSQDHADKLEEEMFEELFGTDKKDEKKDEDLVSLM